MNCKQGDLAVLTQGELAGSIVRCIERYDGPWAQCPYMPGWRVEWQTPKPEHWEYLADFALKPIPALPLEADQEVEQALGKPQEVTA